MAERLERVAWLAEVLNCSPSTAYYLISTGRVPGVIRLGPSAIRLDPDAVLEWIASGGFEADAASAEVAR